MEIINNEDKDHIKIIGKSEHRHEVKGIKYLLSIGYKEKDIKINTIKGYKDDEGSGVPDISTSDGQQWEIKVVENTCWIKFTSDQFKKFKDDVNVIIFKPNGLFLDNIKFGDIKNNIKNHSNHTNGINQYRFVVSFRIDIHHANKIIKLLDIINDNTAFMLSGAPKELIRDFINDHPEGYIRQIIEDEDLKQLYNFTYAKELLNKKYNEKQKIVDDYTNENYPMKTIETENGIYTYRENTKQIIKNKNSNNISLMNPILHNEEVKK